jgi:GT2 family glycosyltransferase
MQHNAEQRPLELAIIIATLNRSAWVQQVLFDVANQLEDGMEVVVVDQSQPQGFDQTARYIGAMSDPRVRHLALDPPSLPVARNVGVANSKAPVLLFLDDDVRLAPGCLRAHLASYKRDNLGGVVGRIVERDPKENARGLINEVGPGGRVRSNLGGDINGPVGMLKGANMSVLRVAFEQAGGFDDGFLGTAFLEEADFSERVRRAGWSLRFVSEASVVHAQAPEGGCRVGGSHPAEGWRFRNTGRFWRRNRSSWGLFRVVPTFLMVAIKRSWEWRDASSVVRLMQSFAGGWKDGQSQTEA